ncbi:MAG TPA: hypothetical protein VIE89_33860 [Candidatus Binatia bacterium]|jgi:hypothetical protein
MNEGVELGWLSLTDKSHLILTRLHVLQHQDRGIFGESHTIIPRQAITSIQLNWRRSHSLIFLGTIFLVISVILIVSSIVRGPAWVEDLGLSSSAMPFIQYGLLLGGIGVYILFWFAKRNEIQIFTPTATLGGTPVGYEEADKFCALLVSELEDQPRVTHKSKSEEANSPKTPDHDWHL